MVVFPHSFSEITKHWVPLKKTDPFCGRWDGTGSKAPARLFSISTCIDDCGGWLKDRFLLVSLETTPPMVPN